MDENAQVKNPTMADCAQGISAVKAIAIAQSQGQKIYTINQANSRTTTTVGTGWNGAGSSCWVANKAGGC